MSGAVGAARREERVERIAAALRAQWRMIAAVSLRSRGDGEGFEADVFLDPIMVKASYEQQGYPGTPEALAKAEARRRTALADCIGSVNATLPATESIRGFRVVG